MSDRAARKSRVVNWQGPLLAAGIFAAVFAMLLLMAHQNQSNTSDLGSSLREDPYGASLLFDSYRHAGYQVTRGQDEDSLSDQDAAKTTAFFIGGNSPYDWTINGGNLQSGAKFRKRLENFLAHGGRAVLLAPAWKLESKSQGWELENQWEQNPHKSEPAWLSPDFSTMPSDLEKMYLGADGPWLRTDSHWTAMYTKETDTTAHVYMAMRQAGNGELIAASQQSFLLNETIKTHPNPVLLDLLAAGRPVIWVDETLHGLQQDEGVLWLVQRYRLQVALLLFWATLLALLWSMTGDLVRHASNDTDAQIIRLGEIAGVAGQRLLQRSIPKERVVAECWEHFRRCKPQDAKAISTDPLWGARLRTALAAQSPLEGYKELSQLVAEHRAAAKGLGHVSNNARENFMLKR